MKIKQDRIHNRSRYVVMFAVLVAAVLVGCASQEPVIIRVTATSNVQTVELSTPVPTAVLESSATDTAVRPTDTIAPPSATPTESGDGSFLGPLIGRNLTPLPTLTPPPTVSPTTEVLTPSPYPETPVATPLASLPVLDGEQLGIQMYYNVDIDLWWQFMQRVRPMGVGWVKLQADWSFMQPTPEMPSSSDLGFSLFQSHVQRAHNEGFKVLVSIAKAPDWARSGNAEDGPPSDPQALARFINHMLDAFGEQISAIEVWNEPNLLREWNGGLDFSGAGYMQLFDAAYRAIRAREPDMPIITAGLAPTGNSSVTVNDRTFLRQMYAAGLATNGYTNIAIGAHPYGWGNPPDTRCCNPIPNRGWDDSPQFFFIETLEDYREIMVENGHSDVQIWSTEFGWTTWAGVPATPPEAWMTYVSPNQQAQYTLRAFEIGQSRDYLGPMFLWNFNFANETLIQEANEMVGYSLLIPGLAPRPLYQALIDRPK